MRISKLTLPALTVAGALALAGCGGGSDSMQEMAEMGDVGDNDDDADDGTPKHVPILGGFTYDDDDQGLFGSIVAGGEVRLGAAGTGAIISCPDDAENGCTWRYRDDGKIYGTGGAKGAPWKAAAAPTASTEGGGDWLSASNLVKGATGGGTHTFTLERGGVELAIPDTSSDAADIPQSGGQEISLRLRHNRVAAGTEAGTTPSGDVDYLVWGAWEEGPVQDPGPDPKFTVRAAGSMPYVGTPSDQLANALYTNGAVGFEKEGDEGMEPWAGRVRLRANFDTGYISGTVDATGGGVLNSGADVASINLKKTKIGASFSGSATVTRNGSGAGADNLPGSASSGSWEGTFYGPSTAQPTGTAGTFAAKRPKDGTKATAYEIQGAFGTTSVAVLPE